MIPLLLVVSVAYWQRVSVQRRLRSSDAHTHRAWLPAFAGWANGIYVDFSIIQKLYTCIRVAYCMWYTTCGMRKFLSIMPKPAVLTRSLIRRTANERKRNCVSKIWNDLDIPADGDAAVVDTYASLCSYGSNRIQGIHIKRFISFSYHVDEVDAGQNGNIVLCMRRNRAHRRILLGSEVQTCTT